MIHGVEKLAYVQINYPPTAYVHRLLPQGFQSIMWFGKIFKQFQFSEKVFNWTREALQLSQQEKAEFHRKAIEGLHARYLKLQNRIDQMYLDKLDGEVEESFYRKHVKEWREDQNRLQRHIKEAQNADENYIEQGIKLIEITWNAYQFFQSKDQPERADLVYSSKFKSA